MLIKKTSTKNIGTYGWLRLASMVVLGLMGGIILFSTFFIYENIYQTLTNANEAIILSGGVRFETIDETSYRKVEEKITLKQNVPPIPDRLRNPFYFVSSTTAMNPPLLAATTSP